MLVSKVRIDEPTMQASTDNDIRAIRGKFKDNQSAHEPGNASPPPPLLPNKTPTQPRPTIRCKRAFNLGQEAFPPPPSPHAPLSQNYACAHQHTWPVTWPSLPRPDVSMEVSAPTPPHPSWRGLEMRSALEPSRVFLCCFMHFRLARARVSPCFVCQTCRPGMHLAMFTATQVCSTQACMGEFPHTLNATLWPLPLATLTHPSPS